MRLQVELTWWDGLVEEHAPGPPEPDYELFDADTGRSLSDCRFTRFEDVEAYIADNYAECERWKQPAASAEQATALERILDMLESGVELDRVVIRRFLIGQYYQFGYSTDVTARIRTALGHLS